VSRDRNGEIFGTATFPPIDLNCQNATGSGRHQHTSDARSRNASASRRTPTVLPSRRAPSTNIENFDGAQRQEAPEKGGFEAPSGPWGQNSGEHRLGADAVTAPLDQSAKEWARNHDLRALRRALLDLLRRFEE
jgi:hypothetical protein